MNGYLDVVEPIRCECETKRRGSEDGISVFPDVVPGAVTIWDAANDRSRQVFMLWGTALVLPMILGCTAWSCWVFRGKVDADRHHA